MSSRVSTWSGFRAAFSCTSSTTSGSSISLGSSPGRRSSVPRGSGGGIDVRSPLPTWPNSSTRKPALIVGVEHADLHLAEAFPMRRRRPKACVRSTNRLVAKRGVNARSVIGWRGRPPPLRCSKPQACRQDYWHRRLRVSSRAFFRQVDNVCIIAKILSFASLLFRVSAVGFTAAGGPGCLCWPDRRHQFGVCAASVPGGALVSPFRQPARGRAARGPGHLAHGPDTADLTCPRIKLAITQGGEGGSIRWLLWLTAGFLLVRGRGCDPSR